MCGIVGIVSPDPADHALLETATDLLRHRGPDSGGYYVVPPVSLGHRRLAIIDLSPAASQPLCNEDGTLWLVCNGEIYNHKSLTVALLSKGHSFRSHSDSEVLLHLYEERGEAFLDDVNGMFALILWDAKEQKLLAAVDRFGKKPLYYAQLGERLILASEMKALLDFSWVSKTIDIAAMDRYLGLRYIPAPATPFRMVRKMEQAQMLVYQRGETRWNTWWRPRPGMALPGGGLGKTGATGFHELLTDAVKLRLISDVPVGFYLSGGFDSTLVAALAVQGQPSSYKAFTMGFGNRFDETEVAGRVADHLGIPCQVLRVEPDDFSLLDRVVWHLDEPFGDLIALPSYLLAREAKGGATVILTGDGADEILTGYLHQRVMAQRQRHGSWLRWPGVTSLLVGGIKNTPTAMLEKFFDYPDHFGVRERARLGEVVSHAGDWAAFYATLTACFTPKDKSTLLTPEFSQCAASESFADLCRRTVQGMEGFSFLARLSLLDLRWWIPFIVLYRLDKMAMTHAVETRSPFLDYRVVEMGLNLPDAAKLTAGRGKEILFQLHRQILPESLGVHRKQAFYMPFSPHYQGAFRLWAEEMTTRKRVENRGWWNWQAVEEIKRLAQGGSMLANRQWVALASLEHWCKVYSV